MAESIEILSTGVRFAEHPDPESALREHGLTPEVRRDLQAWRDGELVFVVPWSFVEFIDAQGQRQRWEDTIHLPQAVRGAATSTLLRLVADEQSLDADLGIAGHSFTRFEFAAAPRRIEIDEDLAAKLDLD